MRNGRGRKSKTMRVVVSLKGIPRFIPTFPTYGTSKSEGSAFSGTCIPITKVEGARKTCHALEGKTKSDLLQVGSGLGGMFRREAAGFPGRGRDLVRGPRERSGFEPFRACGRGAAARVGRTDSFTGHWRNGSTPPAGFLTAVQ